jgi:hypothetical protein
MEGFDQRVSWNVISLAAIANLTEMQRSKAQIVHCGCFTGRNAKTARSAR